MNKSRILGTFETHRNLYVSQTRLQKDCPQFCVGLVSMQSCLRSLTSRRSQLGLAIRGSGSLVSSRRFARMPTVQSRSVQTEAAPSQKTGLKSLEVCFTSSRPSISTFLKSTLRVMSQDGESLTFHLFIVRELSALSGSICHGHSVVTSTGRRAAVSAGPTAGKHIHCRAAWRPEHKEQETAGEVYT